METVHVELPAALLKAADLDAANISEEASRLLALELFREDKVSLGRAAESLPHTFGLVYGFRGKARSSFAVLRFR
ncbi:MAG: UPF0175 family protein [Acidobacteria bacterium]|nr:UPF0175 family protein [Acidobacteriota bacterium]